MINKYKDMSLIIFSYILVILICYCVYIIYNIKYKEYFGNNSDSKRNKMIKIYKNNNILDPDEDPDDEGDDPDSSSGRDPDS